MPLISVIIPAYNHESFVLEAVRSVLDQSVGDLELIVIDDASTDTTWEQLQSISDPRIRCMRHEVNAGAPATLNEGLRLAKAPVVAVLNSDDAYLPERLTCMLSVLDSDPACAAVFSRFELMDARSQPIETPPGHVGEPPLLDAYAGILSEFERRTLQLCAGNFLHTTSNLVCRTEVVRALGGFRDYRYVHDHDFFLRLSVAHAWRILPEPLLRYRHHGHNTLSESATRSVAETMSMLVEFLQAGGLPSLHGDGDGTHAALRYLAEHLRLYGGERWALLLALASAQPAIGSALSGRLTQLGAWQDVAQIAIRDGVAADRLESELAWQRTQTNQWWQQAMAGEQAIEKLANDLAWQKEQTDRWWAAHVEARERYEKARLLGIPYLFRKAARALLKNRH